MTLLEFATQVAELSGRCRDWQERADEVGRLVTRRDQLRVIANRVSSLATTAEVLSNEDSLESRLKPVRELSQKLSVKADDLLRRLETTSESILKPKALDAFESGALDEIQRILTAAWRDLLGTGDQPGIETVLSRFDALRDVVARITQRRRRLQELAATLPTTAAVVAEGRDVKRALADDLGSLTGAGLDDEVASFLRRSVEGVSLEDLLANGRVLAWLAKHGLAGYFRVRSN